LFILAAPAAAAAAAVYQRKEKKKKKTILSANQKDNLYSQQNAVRDAIHTKDYTDGTLLFGSSTPPLLFDFSFLFGLTGAGHQQHFCVRSFPPWLAGWPAKLAHLSNADFLAIQAI
jgi:hypothetical protein